MHKQFNSLALTFLARMEKTFPDEIKIKVYRQKFELLQNANFKAPVEMFVGNMYDYGEQILTKDELFFKKDNFVNNAESISGKMGLINYWDSIEQATKDIIWKYIQDLYILGMRSMGKTDELIAMINKTKFTGT
jgi:hypothetical protein